MFFVGDFSSMGLAPLTFKLERLDYQHVLLHGLIRVSLKIKHTTNNYNYLSHTLFHLLNIITFTIKYIFIIIQFQ